MPISKKHLKASRAFRRYADGKLLPFGRNVCKSMLDNAKQFPRPPVRLEDLGSKLDGFDALLAEKLYGDRRVTAQKNNLREEIIKDLLLLSGYVEFVADDDQAAFVSSGFETVASEYSPPQPLPQPIVEEIKQGNSGELFIKTTSLGRKARGYELGYVEGGENVPDDFWTIKHKATAKEVFQLPGLKPGTIYAFRVRAFGDLGYTDWSDPATRMCI
jgi:hypothetical protein